MVNYNDDFFNMSGKFPTMEDFWQPFASTFVSANGITNGFSQVLGEQVFKPIQPVMTPFYDKFAGRPLPKGQAWMERALYKNLSRHLKPKATANDDLDFEDSTGVEFTYNIDVEGWIKATIPSGIMTVREMLEAGDVAGLNSLLVDNVLKTYQRDMEAMMGLKIVSNIKDDVSGLDFTNDGVGAWKKINEYSIKMKGLANHYNNLTATQNQYIDCRSEKVYCFIDAITFENMVSDFAVLPSPDYINKNCEFIPMVDGLPTPITTAEYTAGGGTDAGGTTISWSTPPIAIDEAKPDAILVSDKFCEYRPLINSYRINLSKNGAGDFENEHLLWAGAIGIRPWENAIRLYD